MAAALGHRAVDSTAPQTSDPGHLSALQHNWDERMYPIGGYFMSKQRADPMLEMADYVAWSVGCNVKYQMQNGRADFTPPFDVPQG